MENEEIHQKQKTKKIQMIFDSLLNSQSNWARGGLIYYSATVEIDQLGIDLDYHSSIIAC